MVAGGMDVRNLIACQPCAKAKAKCDKQIPTCSRCLYKRIRCEQRSPRRYVENVDLPQDPINTVIPPRSPYTSVAGDNQVNVQDALRPIVSIGQNTGYDALPTIESFQWQPESFASANPCPGDLAMNPTVQQLNTLMGNDFSWNQFEATFQETFGPSATDSLSSETHSNRNVFPTPLRDGPARNSSAELADEELPCFRCNPKSDQRINPRIGGEYLQRLEETLNNQSVWTGAEYFRPQLNRAMNLSVNPIGSNLRDKLMVISQSFLSRAREVHRSWNEEDSLGRRNSMLNANLTGFFTLPPSPVLEEFLGTYACRVEPYMPSFSASRIDLSTPMTPTDEKPTILLMLLMIAHGAMGKAEPKARYVAAGLVEICRISIFDILEKDVQIAAQPMMLRCALLYLNAAAWSGFRWHMDVSSPNDHSIAPTLIFRQLSAAHIGMYSSVRTFPTENGRSNINDARVQMAKHAGLLDNRTSPLADVDPPSLTDTEWLSWRSKEFLNRFVRSTS